MSSSADTDATRHETTMPAQALTILRTDTVFAKLPIHTLTKSAPIRIHIHQAAAQGVQELDWCVSPSTVYGPPQLMAYKLDTLVVNRHLDALKRPLPPLIPLGSLRQICQELGLSTGKTTADLKHAFHQNAGVYITAKLRYRDRSGRQRRLEAGFHRYGVIFTGESLPDGTAADAVYLTLNETYRQVLNSAPTRPLDYDYLTDLKPLAQRFYELLSFKMYAALKHQKPRVSVRYSELCQFAPQQRYRDGIRMSKQMYKVHQPHLLSGYLAHTDAERVLDREGHPDWLLHYVPGPKAQAEYQAFHAPGDTRAAGLASAKPVEPTPAAPVSVPACSTPTQTAAEALVRRFYQQVHGLAEMTPHPREIDQASSLMERHGEAFADFFLHEAWRCARQNAFKPHVFGGLLRYEASALAAYARQQRQQAQYDAERAAGREAARHEQYQRHRTRCIQAYRDEIGPEALDGLRQKVRQRLKANSPGIPKAAFDAWVQADLQDQLAQEAGIPDFDDWCTGQSGASPHTREARP